MAPEETVTLTATVSPSGAAISWSSSDETIATVENGVVTAVAEGEAVITVTARYRGNTSTATCTVTVAE